MWWVKRLSSLRFSCSGCARTLPIHMYHACLLGFKSILCAAIGVFVCYKYNLCASSRMTWCVILCQHHHNWNGHEVKEPAQWRHLDVTSSLCFLECVQLFCVCTWKRLCAFCYALFCHIKCFSYKTIHEEYFTTKKRQLHCRAREARTHCYFRTYRSARMVLYIKQVLYFC